MMEGSPPPPDRPLGSDDSDLPEAVVARPSRFLPELVWTIPLVAVLIAGWLGFQALRSRGPTITIQFRAARWLAVGKTKVKYREVDVGEVRAIGFSRDRRTVLVTARLNRDAAPWMVEDTRFWIVEPHVAAGEISGLETLLSGAYIALDVGQSKRPRRQFEGLPTPPVVAGDTPGRPFIARARRGISVGSPIFFRHMEVGQVSGSDLNRDGTSVAINMFVRAPYDRYVTTGTRFWEASGIRGSIDANGVQLETESLVTVLLGGIDFEPGPDSEDAPPAPANHVFVLFPNHQEAMKQPEGASEDYRLVFRQSIRGLGVGAPVDFRGILIGEVTHIGVGYDPARGELSTLVDVRVYPRRLDIDGSPQLREPEIQRRVAEMVEHGLRAQLRSGNLLTGQLYVAIDVFPRAPHARYDPARVPHEIPTVTSDLEDLRASLASFARKVDRFPVEDLAAVVGDTRDFLTKAGSALQHADAAVAGFGPTSPTRTDLDDAVRQVARAARSLRALTDSLERHPESLIRGRK